MLLFSEQHASNIGRIAAVTIPLPSEFRQSKDGKWGII